jgi:hypothetical protein
LAIRVPLARTAQDLRTHFFLLPSNLCPKEKKERRRWPQRIEEDTERELIACGSRQASNFLFDLLVRHDIYEFPFVPLQFLVGVTCHRLSKLKRLFLAHLSFNGALHARMQQHSATNL